MKSLNLFVAVLFCFYAIEIKAEDSFEEHQRKQREAFADFKAQQDKEFAAFLEKRWSEFQFEKGLQSEARPKPKQQPTAVELPPVYNRVRVKDLVMKDVSDYSMDRGYVEFSAFGHRLILPTVSVNLGEISSEKQIADAWLTISQSHYLSVIKEMKRLRLQLQLSDWATLKMVQDYARLIAGKADNLQPFLMVYSMNKLGYDVRLAFQGNSLKFLFSADRGIYGTPYLSIGERRYYILGNHSVDESIYTYDDLVPDETSRPLDLGFDKSFILSESARFEEKPFYFDGEFYTLRIAVDRMTYFSEYPQLELEYYLKSAMPGYLKTQFDNAILPKVSNLPKEQLVQKLLDSVQRLPYAMDIEQFGREKFLSAEETLYYQVSDCEDRSSLLLQLIKEFTDLPSLALLFNSHVAAALHFDNVENVNPNFRFDGTAFWVVDPTYLGAGIGSLMPELVGEKPEFVPLVLDLKTL